MSGKKSRNSIIDNLASGGGLMTAIGLGVGAFEILMDKQRQSDVDRDHSQKSPPVSPPPFPKAASSPPPPPPKTQSSLTESELAIQIIQDMIADDHADGTLDEQEQQKILEKLKEINLSDEEKLFLLEELRHPKTIAELTAGIADSAIAKTMYSLAVKSITIDTDKERKWCDELATKLSLDKSVQHFIEEDL